MAKSVRTATLLGVLLCGWIALGNRTACAWLDCSDPFGSTAYFGNDGFMMDQGWTDQDLIDFCDSVSVGSYCSDHHVCRACNFVEYGPGSCFWDTYCAGCGAGGDNAYYYEADCACEGPDARPE